MGALQVQEELNAALLRQLEERRVIVLPILAEACDIPLFVREKKYADFTGDYSRGLEELLNTLEPPDTLSNARLDIGEYVHDYAFDWGKFNNQHGFQLQISTHSARIPYAVDCSISVAANHRYSKWLDDLKSTGFEYGPSAVLLLFTQKLSASIDNIIFVEGNAEAISRFASYDPLRDVGFTLEIRARRLGPDPGEDFLYEWKTVFDYAVKEHLEGIRAAHSPNELARLDAWLDEHQMPHRM